MYTERYASATATATVTATATATVAARASFWKASSVVMEKALASDRNSKLPFGKQKLLFGKLNRNSKLPFGKLLHFLALASDRIRWLPFGKLDVNRHFRPCFCLVFVGRVVHTNLNIVQFALERSS